MASEYDEDPERTGGGSEVREPAAETDDRTEHAAEPVDESTEAGDAAPAPVEDQQNDAGTTVHEAVDPDAEDDPVDGDDDRALNSDHESDLPAGGDDDLSTNASDELPDQDPGARETPEEVAEVKPVEDTTEDPEPESTGESAEPHESVHESNEPAQDVDAPTEPMYEPVDTMEEPVDLSGEPVDSANESTDALVDSADERVERGHESADEPVDSEVEPVDSADQRLERGDEPAVEPVSSAGERAERGDDSAEARVELTDGSVEPVDESVEPVDLSEEPVEPVRDEAVPDRLPWEGLLSRELRPSPEFQAFLDERHARWKANLADPRHGEGFHGSGSLVTAEADDPGPPNRSDSSPHRPFTPQPQVASRPPVHVDRQESSDEHDSATIELFRVVRYSSGQVEEWASEVDSEIAAGVLPAFQRDAAIDAKIDAYCIGNLRSAARWFTPEAVNTLDDSTHGNAVVQEWTSWGEARRTGTMAPHVMARQYKISVPPGEYLYVGATAPKGYRQSSDPERPTGSSYHSSLSGRELQVYFPPQSDRSGWLVSQVGFPALADASGSQSSDAEFAAALGAPRADQRDKYLRGKPLIGGLAETSAFDLTDVVNDFSGVVYEVEVGIHGRHWSGEAVPSVSTPTTSRGGALTEA